jgi:hypothetical protein
MRRIVIARGNTDGTGHIAFRRDVIGSSEAAVYPAIAVAGDAAVVAGTSGASASSSIRGHRLAGDGHSSH